MSLVLKSRNWLSASSADPTKYSKTFIGLAGFIPSALALVKVFGMDGISFEEVEALLTDADSALVALLSAVSGVVALYGFLRKVYYRLWQFRQKFFE